MSEIPTIALYIDPLSNHFLGDRLFNLNDGRLGGDRERAPYVHLRDYLTARGIEVRTADHLPQKAGDIRNLYVSMGYLRNYRRLSRRDDIMLSAIFAIECPIVEPSLYRALSRVHRYFKRVSSWSDSPSLERFVGTSLHLEPFRWPQAFDRVHEPIWNQTDRKFLVMINANKLPRLYSQELYTERLRAVEFFSRTGEIDLYGVGWDGPPYRVGRTWTPGSLRRAHHEFVRNWQRFRPDPLLQAARRVYRGPTSSKAQTLGQYTFAICFENMILKGWLTEKIFDCFFTGTIPIYLGAPEIEEYIPANCFIDMRRFSNYEDLRAYLRVMTEREITQYTENARGYLESPQFQPFTKDAFVELFCRIIEEDAGVCLA